MPRKRKNEVVDAPKLEVVKEQVEGEDVPEKEDTQQPPELKIGYVVGLTPEGRFVFELLGQERGLVELLGIHQHATKRVNRIYDDNQLGGDRLVHEVGKALGVINQKIEQLLNVVAPRKPDNSLE